LHEKNLIHEGLHKSSTTVDDDNARLPRCLRHPSGFNPMQGVKALEYSLKFSVSLTGEPGKETLGIHNGSPICAILTSSSIAFIASSKKLNLSMPTIDNGPVAEGVITVPSGLDTLPAAKSEMVVTGMVLGGTEPRSAAAMSSEEPGKGYGWCICGGAMRERGLADELGREGADAGELVPEPRVLDAQVVLLQ
jgi:hypothetical protein